MSLTGIIFFACYFLCWCGGILVSPKIAVWGYLATYIVSPASRWWGRGLAAMGFRFSQLMMISLAIGSLLHYKDTRLRRGLNLHELLLILLALIAWISIPLGLPGMGGENFALKLTKIVLFVVLFGRVIMTLRDFESVIWLLVLASAFISFQSEELGIFRGGRIDIGAGGTDFAEGNFLATHLGMMLPFAGLLFFKSGTLKKIIIVACSTMMLNGFFLCRSRGATVALAIGGIFSIMFTSRGIRRKVVFGMVAATIAAAFLVDPGFIFRVKTINPNISNLDSLEPSIAGRIKAWHAALAMARDYPLGIGQGNFGSYVGRYDPDIEGADTHNTYLRCLAELGVQGFAVLLALIANAYLTLWELKKRMIFQTIADDYKWHIYACAAALTIFCVSSVFITHIYVEEFYLLLSFPCLLKSISLDSKRESLSPST